jgi:hypothetical protein
MEKARKRKILSEKKLEQDKVIILVMYEKFTATG